VRPRLQELDRDELFELEMSRGDDVAHAARAEHALDPVLPGKDLPFAHVRHRSMKSTGAQNAQQAKLSKITGGWPLDPPP
jgi:hypothetical protein